MIKKPTLLIDEKKCRLNIKKMCDKAKRNNVDFRPHFKTHQSIEIGNWFKDYGVNKIAVSSLTMAEYFSGDWDDITVAFPVNILEIDTINKLAKRIKLSLLIESAEVAEFLEKNLTVKVDYFIKIDVGYKRTGISPDKTDKIDEILKTSNRSNLLYFKGFLSHAGHTYKCRNKEEILTIHTNSLSNLDSIKERYKEDYPNLIVSYGDTPSCSVSDNFSKVDEIRPGNFVFYDLSQEQIGSCEIEQIAVTMACPIVAIHTDRNEIVTYGGGVHLSKESLQDSNYGTIYGLVVQKENNGWGKVVSNMHVKGLSQEHGIISAETNEISKYKVGDYILILPVHSCMTANLTNKYITTENLEVMKI